MWAIHINSNRMGNSTSELRIDFSHESQMSTVSLSLSLSFSSPRSRSLSFPVRENRGNKTWSGIELEQRKKIGFSDFRRLNSPPCKHWSRFNETLRLTFEVHNGRKRLRDWRLKWYGFLPMIWTFENSITIWTQTHRRIFSHSRLFIKKRKSRDSQLTGTRQL